MQSTNSNTIPSEEIRLLNYSEKMRKSKLSDKVADTYEKNVSFKGAPSKDILPKLAKRIKDTTSKRAYDKKGITEKILSSARFNNMLQFILDNEVLANAGIAFVIGWLLRVPAILAIPDWLGGKHKEDKAMAAAHSGASVTMGLLTAAILTLPINKASKYARESLYHKIKPELLKARHPQLNMDSIKDATGKLLDKNLWKNIDGKPFSMNVKTPMTVARPKYCGDIAESTFKAMGIDIDMAKNAGKATHEMTLRDGSKLIDALKPKDMYIAVTEEGMGTTLKGLKDTNFFSLEYIDKEFLSKAMPELDMNTAFVEGKITHPSTWKTKTGESASKFDIYISNYLETAESTPVYTGAKRIEEGNIQKYVAYQDNGNGGLGSAITTDMVLKDKNVDTVNKIIGWAVEILTRVPVGLCTVAMIPKILNIFDNFKAKKQPEKSIKEEAKDNIALQQKEDKAGNVSFKGKKPNPNKVTKWLGKNYALKLLNSDKIQKFVEQFDKKFNMSMTEAMTILGSLFMSGSYVAGTLTNKNFDKDRKTTLAINQTLGFVIPTALGAWIGAKIRSRVKEVTYKFAGLQAQRIKLQAQSGKITKEAEAEALKTIAKASKGVPVLAGLTVFTFIYRFFTPVAITPGANYLGDKWNNRKKSKVLAEQQKARELKLEPKNADSEKEIRLEPQVNAKSVA